jgi:hypothetical protein
LRPILKFGATFRSGENGLKPGWIKCKIIFARPLSKRLTNHGVQAFGEFFGNGGGGLAGLHLTAQSDCPLESCQAGLAGLALPKVFFNHLASGLIQFMIDVIR